MYIEFDGNILRWENNELEVYLASDRRVTIKCTKLEALGIVSRSYLDRKNMASLLRELILSDYPQGVGF